MERWRACQHANRSRWRWQNFCATGFERLCGAVGL